MQQQRGFTLVEMVMVIVITGIVASMVAVFIAGPVGGYVASVRRAGMTDVADLALKRMALDIRTAVPNSVRVDATGKFIEFIPAKTGGRYCTDSDIGCDKLDFAAVTDPTTFDVLGPPLNQTNETPAADDFLVIYNTGQYVTGQPGSNAYAADNNNRRTIADGTTATAIKFTGTKFPFASPSNRFQVVPHTGPVTFACEGIDGATSGTGTLTLRRYTGYNTDATFKDPQPTPTDLTGLGTNARLADNLSDCNFTYNNTDSATDGLLRLSLTLTRESESITLFYEIHVDNMP